MEDIKESNVKTFCVKNIFIILGFISLMAVIALIAVGLTQNKSLARNMKFGIVLDAGSSHTNLYIYNWPAEKENDTGVVEQIEECRVKGSGISKYATKISELSTYLTACMERAMKVVPVTQHPETPVYLGATAGMRLLRLEDKYLSENVLNAVSRTISNYPFNFQGAKIISGSEEGAYGWITVNYLLGKFTQNANWLTLITGENDKWETYGALDLGGASTQITFVPPNHTVESSDNSLYFRLYGRDYYIYTHSFLCYGKDEALLQKLAKDIQFLSTEILLDPCFHTEYEKIVNISNLYKSPCTKKFEKNLVFDQIQIIGTGDYQRCQQSILELFNTSYCPYTQCAFNGVFLPPLEGNFGAFSAFYFVMNFLNLTLESKVFSQQEMMRKMKEFCSLPWSVVKASFPEVKEKYLSEYCFSGIYILALLQQGYHFTERSWDTIHIFDKVKGSSVGWTLGYMLNLTNMIPAEQPTYPSFSHSTYVFLMVLFSMILAAGIILSVCFFKKPAYFWSEME